MTSVSESLKRLKGEGTGPSGEHISLPDRADDAVVEPQALLSGSSETAARQSILKLASAISKPQADPNSLNGLVSEMLRPMLQEWFNAHVPDIVDRIVAQEIAKLSTASK